MAAAFLAQQVELQRRAGVTVRRLGPLDGWVRQFGIDAPPGGSLAVDDLRALAGPLQDMLRLPLPFLVKVKFVLQYVVPGGDDPYGDDEAAGRPQRNAAVSNYTVDPAPWRVEPQADVAARMDSIVARARDGLDAHLEAARVRGSGEAVGDLLHIFLLVGPAAAMAQLPPVPGAGDPAVGARHQQHPLPPYLAK